MLNITDPWGNVNQNHFISSKTAVIFKILQKNNNKEGEKLGLTCADGNEKCTAIIENSLPIP